MPTIKTLHNRDTGQMFREKINENFNNLSAYAEREIANTNTLIEDRYRTLSSEVEPKIGDIVFNVRDMDKAKYLPCDGREIDAINYPSLASVIKDKYLFVADDPITTQLGATSPHTAGARVWKNALYIWCGNNLFKSSDAVNYSVVETGINAVPSAVTFYVHDNCLILYVKTNDSYLILWTVDGVNWSRVQSNTAIENISGLFYYNGAVYKTSNDSNGSSIQRFEADGSWTVIKEWLSSVYPRPYSYVTYAFGKYYVVCKTGSGNSYRVYSTTNWSTFSEVTYTGSTYRIEGLVLLNDKSLWITSYKGSSSSSSPGYYIATSLDGTAFIGGIYNDSYTPRYFDSASSLYICGNGYSGYTTITISSGAFSIGSIKSIAETGYDYATPIAAFHGVYFKIAYDSGSTRYLYIGTSADKYQLKNPFYDGSYLQIDASTYARANSDGGKFLSLALIDKDLNITYKLHKLDSTVTVPSDSTVYITSSKNRKLCINTKSPSYALLNIDVDTGEYAQYTVKNASGGSLGSDAYQIFMIGSTPFLRYEGGIYKGVLSGSVITFSEIRTDMGTHYKFGYLGNKVFFRYSTGIYSLNEAGTIERIGPYNAEKYGSSAWNAYEIDGVMVLGMMQCTDGDRVYGFDKYYNPDYPQYEGPGVRLFGGYLGGSYIYDLNHRFEKIYSPNGVATGGIKAILSFQNVCYIVKNSEATPIYKGGRLPIQPGAYIKAVN